MRRTRGMIWVSGLLSLALTVGAAQAQSGSVAVAPDSAAPTPDSAGAEGSKKGGLFGKAKKFVGNKTVQTVAKTVACNMVPGGQVVAGAIDAASSKNVGEAAAGAAGAASGQTCTPPGMAGMGAGSMGAGAVGAGMMPGVAGVAGVAGVPGVGGVAGMPPGLGASGLAATMVGAGGLDGADMDAMSSPDVLAGCMGLTPEEYLAFTNPTGGQSRQPTKAEQKRQRELTKKIDMSRYQACMMARSSAPSPDDAVAGGSLSEAAGKSVALSPDLAAELAKGRTVVKDIDWLAGGGDVSPAGADSFAEAMATLAAAIGKTGGSYRVDIYLDKRYDDVAVAPIGAARLKAVQAALEQAGLTSGVITPGTAKKDKKPRLEIVKAKK